MKSALQISKNILIDEKRKTKTAAMVDNGCRGFV
jgi:hypothetical protein